MCEEKSLFCKYSIAILLMCFLLMKVLNDTVLNLYVAVAKRSPIYK